MKNLDDKIIQMAYTNPKPGQTNPPYQDLFFDNDFRICFNHLSKDRDTLYHTHSYYEFELVVDGFGINNLMSQKIEISRGIFSFCLRLSFTT